ncbi:MAG: type II toxin-antitoxin system RelE/ParE family toxin [Campylobacteraceae bacterium]|nr:type II toxin-antitoxin system RelE/ParE family toxin [Campylobacteraceae bacterium]
MSYKIEFNPQASKELLKLDKSVRTFILDELSEFEAKFSLEYEKELTKTGKIKHLKGEFLGLYRLRLRTYRIIYEKQNDRLVIYILRVAHRKEVY